jgi:hypothetical protein
VDQFTGFGCSFLTKTERRRASPPPGREAASPTGDPPEDGGPDEAPSFIAETAAELALLARRHRLDLLVRLLEMAQLEAEERLRLRSRRKLS